MAPTPAASRRPLPPLRGRGVKIKRKKRLARVWLLPNFLPLSHEVGAGVGTQYRGWGQNILSMNIAIALILHPAGGTLLIAQRKDGVHKAGYWEFPGGKCLDGETPADCAVRETHEETGLKITILEAWPIITHEYPERTVSLHPFLCQASSGDAQPRESKQIAWVLPEELNRYQFPEANAPILERLQGNPSGFTG